MRVLGIDPGTQITGYGCLELDPQRGVPVVCEAGIIQLKRTTVLADRLAALHHELTSILDSLSPDVIAVEALFSHYRHARTAITMAHARGVVLLAARRCGAQLEELGATEVKKAVTGNGHATKRQIQEAIMAQCSLSTLPSPPDVADALAIGLCSARRLAASPSV